MNIKLNPTANLYQLELKNTNLTSELKTLIAQELGENVKDINGALFQEVSNSDGTHYQITKVLVSLIPTLN